MHATASFELFTLLVRPVLDRRDGFPLETELRIDTALAERVTAARASGARILYLGDTDLPRDFLLQRLAPVWQSGDTLLLSHEAGHAMARDWWPKLARQFPLPWHHIGDDVDRDVRRPKHHGITTELWTPSRLSPAERALQRENPTLPLAAGLSRLVRRSRPAGVHALWDDGADVSGPLFYGFVQWVLSEARKQGITWVGFLARDGQLPEKIARLMRQREPALPEARYICGSRHAWYLALFDPALPRHRQWVNLLPDPTLTALFNNLEIDPMDLQNDLRGIGHPPESWNAPLSYGERLGVLEELSKREHAAALFKQRRDDRLERALSYLEQEGVFRHQRVALVDIGWSGSMLDAFRELLARASVPAPEVTGLFFGLHQYSAPDRKSYLLHPTSWPDWLTAFPSVVEMLTPADHGQTVDYARNGDRIEPVYADDQVAPAEEVAALHDGALEYVQLALAANAPAPECRSLLWEFISHPTTAQVGRWNGFRFWTWQKPVDGMPPPLIRTLSVGELLRRALSPFRSVDAWPWPTASIRLSFPRTPELMLTLLVHKMQLDRFGLGYFYRVLHLGKRLRARLRLPGRG